MAAKKKTIKKVTRIPDANVTIEVEETEKDEVTPVVEEIKVEETEEIEVTEKVEEAEKENSEEEEEEETTKKEDSEIVTKTENEPFSDNPNENDSFSWKKVILFAIIAAAIGFAIVGGYLYLKSGYKVDISRNGDTDKSIEMPTKEPTPTTTAVDKSKYQIEVLNGSGIAGEAANVQEILEDAGFSVGAIGNADSANYTDTIIAANEDVEEEFINELKKALEKRGPVEIEELSSDEDGDVVVTAGSSLNDDATPTP